MRINGQFSAWWAEFTSINEDYLARHEVVDDLRDLADASAEARGQAERNAQEGGIANIRRSHEVMCRECWRSSSDAASFLRRVREFCPEARLPHVEDGGAAERTAIYGFDPAAAPRKALYIVNVEGAERRFAFRGTVLAFFRRAGEGATIHWEALL